MKAIFLSDAHIKNQKSRGYHNILRFFDSIADDVTDLFIVGDFFDFWFCSNGNIYRQFRLMVDKLLELKNRGLAIHLFEGNHDFFLDEFFGGYGIEVFPDGAAVDMEGRSIFVSHGDMVDTGNKPYLFLRKVLRSSVFYHIQRRLPSALLWEVARLSSKMSKEYLARPQDGAVRMMRTFSMQKFYEGYNAVILGHCHQPAIEHYMIGGRERTFVLLGDWIVHDSYLLYENGTFTLCSFPSSIE